MMATEKLKQYFEFSLGDKNRMNGLCKLCNRNYKDLRGINSNFLKHIKRKHLSEYQKTFSPRTDEDFLEEIDSPDDHPSAANDSIHMNNKQNRICLSVAKNLIIKCNLPLTIIENAAFREFVKECYPKWQPISSKKVKSDIMCSFKDRVHKIICETLEKVNDLTLTIDTWSDRRSRSFLGITCHFIDDRMVPQAFLIDFVRMKSPHTSNNIQRLTEYVLDRFNIKTKVYRIITDNASSMIKAYKFGLAVDENHPMHDDQNKISTTDDHSAFDNYDRK